MEASQAFARSRRPRNPHPPKRSGRLQSRKEKEVVEGAGKEGAGSAAAPAPSLEVPKEVMTFTDLGACLHRRSHRGVQGRRVKKSGDDLAAAAPLPEDKDTAQLMQLARSKGSLTLHELSMLLHLQLKPAMEQLLRVPDNA